MYAYASQASARQGHQLTRKGFSPRPWPWPWVDGLGSSEFVDGSLTRGTEQDWVPRAVTQLHKCTNSEDPRPWVDWSTPRSPSVTPRRGQAANERRRRGPGTPIGVRPVLLLRWPAGRRKTSLGMMRVILSSKGKKSICSPYLLHFNLTTLIADGIDQPAVSWLVLFVNGRFATKSNPTVHIDDVCDTCAVQFSNPYYCCHILTSIENRYVANKRPVRHGRSEINYISVLEYLSFYSLILIKTRLIKKTERVDTIERVVLDLSTFSNRIRSLRFFQTLRLCMLFARAFHEKLCHLG
jgi:hypothetical protein